MDLAVRSAQRADIDGLSTAFADWPKERSLFEHYLALAETGERDVVAAFLDGTAVGYLTIAWTSHYPPFAAARVPEIVDFNVVLGARRQGVGRALMDEAERRIAERTDVAGIGVGMYRDYGSAQRMYVQRGYIPDGAGLVVDGVAPEPGATIVLDDSPTLMFTKRLR